jgi:hypothetical protein
MGLEAVATVKETLDVKIVNPKTQEVILNEEDGSEMFITLHGPYSSKHKAKRHEQQNKRFAAAQKAGGNLSLTSEELDNSALELLVACTEGWNLSVGKKKETFSPERAREIYTKFPWVRKQVETVIGDDIAFLE